MDPVLRCDHCGGLLTDREEWASLMASGDEERVVARIHDRCRRAYSLAHRGEGSSVYMYEEGTEGPLSEGF